jgi:thiamine biosynthesis protein ThiI
MEGKTRNVLIVRLGEITIKGERSRDRFEKKLVANMKEALRLHGLQGEVRRGYGRIYVYSSSEAIEVLRRIFGITSISNAVEFEFETLEEIVETAYHMFCDKVKGKTFAVRARRTGSHTFTSMDVAREVGARLYPCSRGVDLENPELTVHVEIRGDKAYLFTDVVRAYGGLPVGTEGRVVALVSGGFDSIVAAWFMLKRGAEVHYVFCNMAGELTEKLVASVAKILVDNWSYGYSPKLYVADFKPLLKELRGKVDPGLMGVLLKRYMYRTAEYIARKINALGIVTGESLGQVSSQTLENLYSSSVAASIPIYRPLIGMDKEEIISIAREIGTYEASARVKEICGVYSVHPRTRSRLEEVVREEEKVDKTVFDKVLSSIREIDLRIFSPKEEKLEEDIEVSIISSDSVVIDLRPPEKYLEGHVPGSINIDFADLPLAAVKLDPSKKYILICDEGGLSREAAHMLRKLGYKAWSLKGGYRALSKKLGAQPF